jgi:hypothetical protein
MRFNQFDKTCLTIINNIITQICVLIIVNISTLSIITQYTSVDESAIPRGYIMS